MTFNIQIFVSILLLLPNAYSLPKASTKSMAKFIGVEEDSEDYDKEVEKLYKPKTDEDEDVMLQAAIDDPNDDYVVNIDELSATEAPEMDELAELVDENGQRETEEPEDETEGDGEVGPPTRPGKVGTEDDDDIGPPKRPNKKSTEDDDDIGPPKRPNKKSTEDDDDIGPPKRPNKKSEEDDDEYIGPPTRPGQAKKTKDISAPTKPPKGGKVSADDEYEGPPTKPMKKVIRISTTRKSKTTTDEPNDYSDEDIGPPTRPKPKAKTTTESDDDSGPPIRPITPSNKFKETTTEDPVTQLRRTCLELNQDSGYWCEDSQVSRLNYRFYYQRQTKSCQCFLYYGCQGNKNNFDTILECKDICGQFGWDETKKINETESEKKCRINP